MYDCDRGTSDDAASLLRIYRVNYPILPTREVHVSVVSLIEAATKKEVTDPVVRKCLINLLNILWKKLRADPVQTEFFFLHAETLRLRRSGAGGEISAAAQTADASELVLFTGLLPHMYAVGKIGEKCREALVIAAGVHEKTLCRFVLQLTPFCHYAVNGVISAYDNLPKVLTSASYGGTDSDLQFMATRLRFCCTLTMVGRFELLEVNKETGDEQYLSIAREILTQFRTRFLEGPLLEGLLNTSEALAQSSTLYARIILEELSSCGRDADTNPLLYDYLRFMLDEEAVSDSIPENQDDVSPIRRLPTEMMQRINSLSSSLSIATIDLYTYLLEFQDEYIDSALLGDISEDRGSNVSVGNGKPSSGVVWFASRFPNSAVASNVHLWAMQGGYAGGMDDHDIPTADDDKGQMVSLMSYIADAEYVTVRQTPMKVEDDSDDDIEHVENDSHDDDTDNEGQPRVASLTQTNIARQSSTEESKSPDGKSRNSRSAMKPLKDVYLTIALPSYTPVSPRFQPRRASDATSLRKQKSMSEATIGSDGSSVELSLFVRVILTRLERLLENSFQENLALSGLISALAQKICCSTVVFDMAERQPSGQSVRSVLEEVYSDALRRIERLQNGQAKLQEIRTKLVDNDNDTALNEHDVESRLLCGFIVLEEILKELCSLLFARERAKSLPLKPEGYYLGAKRTSTSRSPRSASNAMGSDLFSPRSASSETGDNDLQAEEDDRTSLGKEFEQMLAEAESDMESLLQESEKTPAPSPTKVFHVTASEPTTA